MYTKALKISLQVCNICKVYVGMKAPTVKEGCEILLTYYAYNLFTFCTKQNIESES
jgi:hypothetical protein